MDWDQIESKWATMTGRVRAGGSIRKLDVARLPRKIDTADAKISIGPDQAASAKSDQQPGVLVQ